MEMVKIEQKPLFSNSFKEISESLKERLKIADNVIVTDDTKKDVKVLKAKLNNERDTYKAEFKEFKDEYMKPLKEYESEFKEYVLKPYNDAEEKLKTQIDEIENREKEETKVLLVKIFNDLCTKHSIDFVTFEDVGLNITLSASEKSLIDKVNAFIDTIVSDLAVIQVIENSTEILVEYKKHRDLKQAIDDVASKKRAIENEEKFKMKFRVEAEQLEPEKPVLKNATKVSDVISTYTLKVTGTTEQFGKLVQALNNIGMTYERE